tara:strand:+ start:209 stop:364 length:156 start_codon:yes stop_codon:yes gene_type:complete
MKDLMVVFLLVKSSDSLLLGQYLWVFDGVGEQVVNLLEAEVFAIVVRFGHD